MTCSPYAGATKYAAAFADDMRRRAVDRARDRGLREGAWQARGGWEQNDAQVRAKPGRYDSVPSEINWRVWGGILGGRPPGLSAFKCDACRRQKHTAAFCQRKGHLAAAAAGAIYVYAAWLLAAYYDMSVL